MPKRTVSGRDVVISRPGAVVQDLRLIDGTLVIDADNVVVRRVEIQGGSIKNWVGSDCHSGLKVRATTLMRSPGQVTTGDEPTLESGGYSANRVEILGLSEGFRVGGKEECGPVRIVNSYAQIHSPDSCGDWHGDGLQGYDGGHLVLRNSVLKLVERPDCGGTAPFFYPENQGNTSVAIDGLIVEGAATPSAWGCAAMCATSTSCRARGATVPSRSDARRSARGAQTSSSSRAGNPASCALSAATPDLTQAVTRDSGGAGPP